MSRYPRRDLQYSADERTTLDDFLDHHRVTLLRQAEGLTDEQLRTPLAPSTMTLGGLLSHMAWVENWWFGEMLLGLEPDVPWRDADWVADDDWEWSVAQQRSGDELRDLFAASVDRSRELASGLDLDQLSVRRSRRTDEPWNLRWVYVHMIEEYARHCGHADLIRESIDGATDL